MGGMDVFTSCGSGMGLVDVPPGQTIVLVWRIVEFGVLRGLQRGATLLAASRDESVVHWSAAGFHRPSDLIRLAGGCAAENADRLRFLGWGFIEMTWGANTGVSTGVLKSNVDARTSRRRFSSTAERTLYHLKHRSGLMRKTSSKASECQVALPCAKSLAALRLVMSTSGMRSDRTEGWPWSPKGSTGWLQTKSISKVLGDRPY